MNLLLLHAAMLYPGLFAEQEDVPDVFPNPSTEGLLRVLGALSAGCQLLSEAGTVKVRKGNDMSAEE